MQTSAAETEPSWCLGLPFLASGPLTPAETRAAQGRSRRLALGMTVAVLFVPALFAASTIVELWVPQMADAFDTVVAVVLLVGIPAAVLFLLRFGVEYRRIQRDVKEGCALVFRGPVRHRTPNRIRDRLERQALSRLPDDGTLEVRALPHSRCWLRPVTPSGARFEFLRVHLQHAAPPPDYAWRVPVHRDLPVVPLPGIQLEQRRLTELERIEIASYARQLLTPDFKMIYRLAICGLFSWMGLRDRAAGGHGILLIVAIAMLAFHAPGYWRRFRLASRLRSDLATGRTISASIARAADSDAASAPEPAGAEAAEPEAPRPAPREFLPFSQMLWTEGGRPASWRETGKLLRTAA